MDLWLSNVRAIANTAFPESGTKTPFVRLPARTGRQSPLIASGEGHHSWGATERTLGAFVRILMLLARDVPARCGSTRSSRRTHASARQRGSAPSVNDHLWDEVGPAALTLCELPQALIAQRGSAQTGPMVRTRVRATSPLGRAYVAAL